MKSSSSLRQLATAIEAISGAACAWILFDPASPAQQKMWRPGARELVRPYRPEGVAAAIRGVPIGGQCATNRVEWVNKLSAALTITDDGTSQFLVLPILERDRVTVCVGWFWPGQAGGACRSLPHLSAVRAQVRKACTLEKARTEAEALRWLLSRSDRLCVVARPDGELIGASPCARDFLLTLRFGRRHFFRTDEPELPSFLAGSIGQSDSGQVVLNKSCTARFDRLAQTSGGWMPVIGIECFTESPTPSALPLSRLTAVERDIYTQITTTGATNREIAARRGTSYATVKNQVSHLLDKLGVSRRINLLSPGGPQFFQAMSAFERGSSTGVIR